jgi:hypothetical protein
MKIFKAYRKIWNSWSAGGNLRIIGRHARLSEIARNMTTPEGVNR